MVCRPVWIRKYPIASTIKPTSNADAHQGRSACNPIIAAAMMSIQSIKGVELGDAFANSARNGSEAHDIIDYDAERGWVPALPSRPMALQGFGS